MMRNVFAWTLFVGYCGLLTALSSMSHIPVRMPDVHLVDKVVHTLAFGGLAVLALAVSHTSMSRWGPRAHALFAWLFTSTFGVIDEFHQRTVPGRAFELLDMVADALGATIVVGVYYGFATRRRGRVEA